MPSKKPRKSVKKTQKNKTSSCAKAVDNSEEQPKEEKKKCNLGEYAEKGGPGRPKGSKNKFTLIKEALANAFINSDAERVLTETLVREKRDMFGKKILDDDGKPILEVDKTHLSQIIAILPKEPLIDQSEHTHITYVWSGYKKRQRESGNEGDRDTVRSSRLPDREHNASSSI